MSDLRKEKDAALLCAILLVKELADAKSLADTANKEKIARLRATLIEAANQAYPHMTFE